MLYDNQDILWRRKLEEQADLQQAIELQNRRLMSLKLLDVKRSNHHRAFSTGAVNLSPTFTPNLYSRSAMLSCSDRSSPEFMEGIVLHDIYSSILVVSFFLSRLVAVDKCANTDYSVFQLLLISEREWFGSQRHPPANVRCK